MRAEKTVEPSQNSGMKTIVDLDIVVKGFEFGPGKPSDSCKDFYENAATRLTCKKAQSKWYGLDQQAAFLSKPNSDGSTIVFSSSIVQVGNW